jgi:hypothetical protein
MTCRAALTAVVLAGTLAAVPAQAKIVSWAHGSWSWFGDPRAVQVDGQYDETFAGWIDWQGRVTIGAYDPRFGFLRDHVVGRIFPDDHSAPSILVEPDQRLTVFWSGHNGTNMYYRSTLRPQDISSWSRVAQVHQRISGRDGFTYPNPVLLSAEADKLYLFWRGSDWSADYATRTLSGDWSASHELIRQPGQRPYVKVAGNGSDTIALAFTNGHPRNVLTSIYYAAYRKGWLWTANGQRIARVGHGPILPGRAQLVSNARRSRIGSWVWDVAFGQDGRPVIVYATFPTNADHVYWYARFNGRRWVNHRMTAAGGSISPQTIEYEYSGGITLDHSNPSIVYLSRQVRRGWEIERWVTGDGGLRWHHATVVRADGTDEVRPVVPRGYSGGPMGLLWLRGDYRSYTTYRTSIAFLR